MSKTKVIKISPQLDPASARRLESQLNRVFMRVGRTFGNTLKRTFRFVGRNFASGFKTLIGGSLFGAGMRLVQSMTEQFQNASANIDTYLKKADDLATLAESFNTSPGQILRLMQVGEVTGVDQESMLRMLNRVSKLLGQEKQSPGSTILNSKNGFSDNAFTAFTQIISALQNMPQNERAAKFSEIFGERPLGKTMELLTTDLYKLSQNLEALNPQFDNQIFKGGMLEQEQAILRQNTEQDKFYKFISATNEETLKIQNEYFRLKNQRDAEAISALKESAAVVTKIEESGQFIVKNMNVLVSELVPAVEGILSLIKKTAPVLQKLANSQKTRSEKGSGIN